MKKLSILLVAALFLFLATRSAKADIELDITCGCHSATPTPTVQPTQTPAPTPLPTQTPVPSNSTPPNGQVGAPQCPNMTPDNPVLTSVVQKNGKAILTWTKVNSADHYMIFYGTDPANFQYGVTDTGNVTTFTINFLDPGVKYYFDVRAVSGCAPSNKGQVLGASTSVLGATDSEMIPSRLILAILTAGVTFKLVKKYNI